ncbi:putative F-box protein At4g17565 [Rosa rugosa]|uniref:putative F-box protein At4g17565 n=1 Tax=Rosa rugosa TaxID=74645 RepID=UPI002B403091|nr:putative F-box protein At4g17565 [Rosa rugosa]
MVEEMFPSWIKKRKRDPRSTVVENKSTKRRKRTNTSWSSSKWSELQPELLEMIIKRLSFVGMLRFKAVCSSWNSIARSYAASIINQTPWLTLPSDDDHTRRFYSLEEKKVYTVKNSFQDFPGASWCVGSSHGWLVILDDPNNIPHLFNPISENRSMELPHIPSTTNSLLGSPPFYHVAKAVLSSDPSCNNNFSAAIIYGIQPSRLAFYNHGDEEWTDLNGEHQEYCDIIFHNDKLFALADNGCVEAWDFRKPSPKKIINLQPASAKELDLDYTSNRDKFSTNTYLVESSDEIMSVVRCIGNFVNEEGKAIHEIDVPDEPYSPCPYRTLQFYVFKLNFAANKWEKVECLPNCALFLGGSQSISLSTKDVSGCEENSIYFTDDRWDEIELLGDTDSYGGHDMGVYNLEDKVVKQFYPFDKWRIDPPPFWIVPSPW